MSASAGPEWPQFSPVSMYWSSACKRTGFRKTDSSALAAENWRQRADEGQEDPHKSQRAHHICPSTSWDRLLVCTQTDWYVRHRTNAAALSRAARGMLPRHQPSGCGGFWPNLASYLAENLASSSGWQMKHCDSGRS